MLMSTLLPRFAGEEKRSMGQSLRRMVLYKLPFGRRAMRTVSMVEAKNRLSALLDEVQGGDITITRHGKPVARLAALTNEPNHDRARAAADGLRALSKGYTLNGITIKDLISEGRGPS
jgi:antitoxin (DNA-binding transcriptional repressor) of toxin-antitoxin stability system